MILNIFDDLQDFFSPVVDFFVNIWHSIQDFFLQYMSQGAFNIFIFISIVAIILFVVLAIINRD